LSRAAGQNVGNYAITLGTLSAGGNYAISFTSAVFAITPALLSVTANAQTKIYGANDPKLTYTFSGLTNGDTSAVFSGALSRAAGQNVGNYAITQGTLSAGGNYTVSFTGANFAITPATLTYVANSVNRIYGSANPALGGKITGFVNGDTLATATSGSLSFATSATSASNVGSYAITGSGLSANNGNYVFVQAAGNASALTINPATLTYVATSGTIDQGTPIPLLTGTVNGFVNGDTLASATTGSLVFTTLATSSSPPGVYAINGSGLSADHGNYIFVQDPGNATALKINNVVVQNVGLDGFFPWTSGGDRPGDENSGLGQYDNGGDQVYVVADGGGASNLPGGDVTTLSGPIAELAASQGYVDPPTNADRRSSSLSRYFDNGSLFDGNFPSWGNDALWP
jgi:type IV secretory pathway protease TraF